MDRTRLALCVVAIIVAGPANAAAPANDAASEGARADQLYAQGNCEAALPLYERLARSDIANSVIASRLGFCLYAAMELLPAGKERDDLIVRSRQEVERAMALGDRGLLLQQVLARLQSADIHQPSQEQQQIRAAEAAFTKGDLDAALAGYKAVAASNPASYLAHLYAGDVHFAKGEAAAAAEWFGKAIAIDPDVETAHRYWGDALAKAGNETAALPHYIRAVVAEPYKKTTWAALQNWVQRNGLQTLMPQLPRPQVSITDEGEGDGPQPNITVNPELLSEKNSGTAWLAYAANRTVWMQGRFLQRNPAAKAYRHSLQEEVESMQLAVSVIEGDLAEVAQLPMLRDLVRLAEDGMLEAYVLLNAADEGIAQDYVAYRAGHRELLAAYIEKYLIGRPEAAR